MNTNRWSLFHKKKKQKNLAPKSNESFWCKFWKKWSKLIKCWGARKTRDFLSWLCGAKQTTWKLVKPVHFAPLTIHWIVSQSYSTFWHRIKKKYSRKSTLCFSKEFWKDKKKLPTYRAGGKTSDILGSERRKTVRLQTFFQAGPFFPAHT